MDINRLSAYNQAMVDKQKKQVNDREKDRLEDEKLKDVCSEFTAIFLKQVFKSMRETVPESNFIDGGFSEDVFTDMLDAEFSKMGSKQKGLDNLSRILYQQLKSGR